MKSIKQKKISNFESLKQFEISPKEQNKTVGGFLFRMTFKILDDTRCNIDRLLGRPGTGGNGDGDW